MEGQTENKLGTVRRLGCIPTTQAAEAKKLLEEKRSIVIKGNPGEGKTTIALHLIDNEIYRDRRVVVYSPKDWKRVDIDWVDIVVLEDILGKYDFDPSCLQEWMVYLPTIQEHVDAEKLWVIIVTRADILAKAVSKLGSIKLFSDHLSLTLSSEHLSNSEKMSILNRQLQRHNKNMKEDEKKKCITNFRGLIGFPQCCLLFAADSKLFERGPGFFKSPKELFFENFYNLKAETFISLAFLFCHGKIYEEYLSPETMPKSSNDLFMELASCLHISKKKAEITLLRNAYEIVEGLYIEKSISNEIISGILVTKTCVWFSHATVCEAVGQVLAKDSLEMVVKHGDPEYLYQRTYTAKAKDKTSENVFLPESVYSLMAERMVHDVIEENFLESVVKHSAFKQNQFLMKLKDVLHKGNMIKDFFMANSHYKLKYRDILMAESRFICQDLSEGECFTFLQYVLQNDDGTVKLVYSHFMEFLACTHNNNSSDCWQCKEKQTVLELAFYYHHFQIADKLIAMNASYTHVSLSNAAKHGGLNRVQTIMEYLKRSHVFNPECVEARKALCRAYISGNQDVIEILLQEGIMLDSVHVVCSVQHGVNNVLIKVVEHLKYHNKWHPQWDPDSIFKYFSHPYMYSDQIFEDGFVPRQHACSIALYIAYCNEKFDIADYLLKNEAKVSMNMLVAVTEHSSKEAVARVIQHLKVNRIWDPNCHDASQALGEAYGAQKYDVCDLLVHEGVLMTMRNLPRVVSRFEVSLTAVKKAVTYLKESDSWDPNCNDASKALEKAYMLHNYDVCDLLIQEGVSLTMKNLPYVFGRFEVSLEAVLKAVQHLKDTNNWDPKCKDASKALEEAYIKQKYDVCDLLIQEGASLTMKNLPYVIGGFKVSLEAVLKVVQHLKDTDNWDPKCEGASKALEEAYEKKNYDVCDLLNQEGVSVTVKHIPHVMLRSLDYVKTVVKQLKDTDSWDPKCNDASEALAKAYSEKKYDVCDLLIKEGVSLTMKNLPHVVEGLEISLDAVKKAVQHLKDTNSWNPKCEDASKALEEAYRQQKYDVCSLLIQEGASLTMENLPSMVGGFEVSLAAVKKAVQHLKDTDNWDPKCDDASKALEEAYGEQKYDVYDLLNQEGVSVTMKRIPHAMLRSLDYVKKVMMQLKDTDSWDPQCDDASEALAKAYSKKKYDVCDLLIQEGASLTMKNLPHVVEGLEISLEAIKKAMQHLKDTNNWDPKCEYASEVLEEAYRQQKYDVYDLLVQEGVSLTMNNLPHVVGGFGISLKAIKKAVQHLKETNNWDPKCEDASKALEEAYRQQKYDICDLLSQEGVSLTMKYLPHVVGGFEVSLEAVMKAVQHLKDTDNWDPNCKDASKALEEAYGQQKYHVCDLLNQEGVSLTMKCISHMMLRSLDYVKNVVKQLNDTDNWEPKCNDASETLEKAYRQQKYDVCDLLIQEGVSLTIKNLLHMVEGMEISLDAVKKAVQHLKDTNNWDPKCEDASEALEKAYREQKYDVCDLLIQKGASLTMKNLSHLVGGVDIPLEAVKKAVQHMKDISNWDPKCEDVSRELDFAYMFQNYDLCDLLVQEGVSVTMKHIPHAMLRSLDYVKKVVKQLKDTDSWDPKCNDASEALAEAYSEKKYDVCDLLIQEGVSLTMKNLPHVVEGLEISLEDIKKTVQHLKGNNNWDPKCKDASKALEKVYRQQMYDVCDLLIKEGASLTMKNLPHVVGGFEVSLEAVKKAVQHLKDTNNWDHKCKDASNALEKAYRRQKYDVCNLLIQEGVSLTMNSLPCLVGGYEVSLEAVKKAVQYLKDTDKWDQKCDDASKALEEAYGEQKYDVCDLLNQEGVSLTMKNLPGVVYRVSLENVKKAIHDWRKDAVFDLLIQDQVSLTIKKYNLARTFHVPLETVKKAIEHLKDHENWDAKSDEASAALANAYSAQLYDVCDLLLEEAVSLTMKNFPGVVVGFEISLEAVQKAMEHLKVTENWDPKCDDASKALANSYSKQNYGVCDLLIQEGVSLTMQTLDGVLEGFQVSLEAVKKALKHLKDTDNWDPSCKHASKGLENAYVVQKYDVCDLLIQEGVSLSMKNVPGVVYSVSLEYVKKAIQHLNKYDLFDLLVLKRVSLSMKNLPCAEGRSQVSLEAVRKVIQHLKDTDNWNPRCGDASEALTNAYSAQMYDVCDLLVQEGVLPNNEESSSYGGGTSGIIGSS